MADVEQASSLASLGKQALVDLLNNLTQAKDFAVGQLPDVCNQYVALGRFSCAAMFVCSLLLVLSAVLYVRWINRTYSKFEKNHDNFDSDGMVLAYVIPTGAILVLATVLFCASMNSVSSWVAPKVYLISEIRELIK